jgi:hypothetical protein
MIKTHAVDRAAATGLMFSISEMARPSDLEALIELIRDSSLGSDRVFLVSNLARSKRPQARAALLDLQEDPDLANEISARLKTSKT